MPALNTLEITPRSVSGRILAELCNRLLAIDGQGEMVNNMEGKIYRRRPNFDTDTMGDRAIFIRRRVGGGTTKTERTAENMTGFTTIVFDVIGLVESAGDSAMAAEELCADIHRAIEISGDWYLREASTGINLLDQELKIIDVAVDDQLAAMPFDIVGCGVECTFLQKYGDPNHAEQS